MSVCNVRAGAVVLWLIATAGIAFAASPQAIKTRLEGVTAGPAISLSGLDAVRRFYQARNYHAVWLDPDGLLNARGRAALAAMRHADEHGLNVADYRVDEIDARLAGGSPDDLADAELLITHGLAAYAPDLAAGRLAPREINSELFVFPRDVAGYTVVQNLSNSGNPEALLRGVVPLNPAYGRLQRTLARYREMATGGGWPAVASDAKLERGDSDEEVRALRARLIVSGDLSSGGGLNLLFDERVEAAVRRFQARHGLVQDGIVGPNTVAALNTPVEERIRQIILNMERWRWMPDDLGARHIIVNIAGFELEAFEGATRVHRMRVVVGRNYRRTPVFSDRMTYIEINPFWNVPAKIASNDLLPKVRADPGFLSAQGFRVFSGWDTQAHELDPLGIDWNKISTGNFPYKLRQDPGPLNSLGAVKFMFPNRFNVYLHDTPARELFSRPSRAFSSGCIRVEDSVGLTNFVLKGHPDWTPESVAQVRASGLRKIIPLERPVDIHLMYQTAWVDADGAVHFRDDIYGRDAALSAAVVTHR